MVMVIWQKEKKKESSTREEGSLCIWFDKCNSWKKNFDDYAKLLRTNLWTFPKGIREGIKGRKP